MPYSTRLPGGAIRYETASSMGHGPTVENERIKERLAHYSQPDANLDFDRISNLVGTAEGLDQPAAPEIRYVVAVDGSGHEYAEAYDQYPSTRVLYLQIAGVFIDLQHMLKHSGPFVSPSRIAESMEASVVSGFLPGSYLEHDEFKDPTQAFRAELYDLFSTTQVQNRSLLDVLGDVQRFGLPRDAEAAKQGEMTLPKCPNTQCSLNDPKEARLAGLAVPLKSPGQCPSCSQILWSTDTFRVYEEFHPDTTNGEVLGRARDIIEHLVLIGVALSFEQLWPKLLPQTAFLYDGDLAVFGNSARMFRGILGCWQALWARCRDRGQKPPVVLGIAKSGYPVEHFKGIQRASAVAECPLPVPPRSFMRLDDSYMEDVLRVQSLTETYYGRKFFYHAADGQLLVITVPPSAGLAYATDKSTGFDDPARFPTLKRTLEVLDQMGSRLYDDAVIPVSLAHNWAAYPLSNADRVLRVLTEQTITKRGS
ncbi:hypothetical protein ACIQCJ_02240 [Streptomyces sp. NPDC093221]|uniref:hypothetical protein n=1 Tax=Streptomyces sp. NPDC093221 TaxID=3366032 RepID=UPI00380C634C